MRSARLAPPTAFSTPRFTVPAGYAWCAPLLPRPIQIACTYVHGACTPRTYGRPVGSDLAGFVVLFLLLLGYSAVQVIHVGQRMSVEDCEWRCQCNSNAASPQQHILCRRSKSFDHRPSSLASTHLRRYTPSLADRVDVAMGMATLPSYYFTKAFFPLATQYDDISRLP